MSLEVTPREPETPSSGRQPSPLQRPFLGRRPHQLQSLSLCSSLLPRQVPWGLGGSKPGWTAPTVWFPQTPEPGWKGNLQGGGSLRPERVGKGLASCGASPQHACRTPA